MFPPDLERRAFRAANGEFGWTRDDARLAVRVLVLQRQAILGGELWWVPSGDVDWTGLIPQRTGPPGAYPWVTTRQAGEEWDDFVARCAQASLSAIDRWPAVGDLPEDLDGRVLYNLTWTSDSTCQALDLRPLEAELTAAIAEQQRDPRELLERLVDGLLTGCAGLSQLNTDGLVVSREFRQADGYLAVGHVWMLPSHVTEPVMVRLVLVEDATTPLAGEVKFGLAPGRPTSPSVSHRKSLKLLLANPDEAQRRIPWAYRFRRDARGWFLADRTHD